MFMILPNNAMIKKDDTSASPMCFRARRASWNSTSRAGSELGLNAVETTRPNENYDLILRKATAETARPNENYDLILRKATAETARFQLIPFNLIHPTAKQIQDLKPDENYYQILRKATTGKK